MRTYHTVKHFSEAIADKHSLPKKSIHKIITRLCVNMGLVVKQKNDIAIDNYIAIFTNKEARLNYFNTKKTKNDKNSESKS